MSTELLESRRLLAIDLQQVANINATNPWGSIRDLTEVGNQAYFVASDPGVNRLDLWITDGTSAGTTRLADLGPSSGNFNPLADSANVGGTFFFRGYDAEHGHELWKSDGTAASTVFVRDLRAGSASSVLSSLVNRDGLLLFSADGQLARSDGTQAGTVNVKDLWAGGDEAVDNLTLIGNTAYFTAKQDESGIDLFKTDGTAAGTLLVEDAGVESIGSLTNVSGELFFTVGGRSLWKSDGNVGSAQLVTDFSTSPFGAYPDHLTNVAGTLYFASNGDLWKSDGTQAGTQRIKNAGDDAYDLVNVGSKLYFTAGTRFLGNGYELWTSDGTAGGTAMVMDISPGFFEGYGDSSYPSDLTELNGKLFFLATDSNGARGVWTTDGTEAGTVRVEGGAASSLVRRQDEILFARQGAVFNTSGLWTSDGAIDSAIEITRSGPGTGNADPSTPVNVGGTLYFSANDGIHGSELWKLAGGSTTLVKDIGSGVRGSVIANLTNVRGTLYFTANDGVHGQELWKSDGTAADTIRLSDINGLFSSATPTSLTEVGNLLFFSAFDVEGWELWKSDGTAAGTLRVKDIQPGSTYEYGSPILPNSSFPSDLVNFNGTLFFSASTATNGRELWKSDGTAAGTVLVKDLFPGMMQYDPYSAYSAEVGGLLNLRGTLYFTATNGDNVRGLWKSDGTAAGTVLVKGTAQGLSNAERLLAVGPTLYFVGTNAKGAELWKSDGTPGGTVLVKDIRAGSESSAIAQLTNVDGRLYFVAGDGTAGRELWQSDGTANGTLLVKDLRTGLGSGNYPLGSNPADFTNLNGVLFFSAEENSGGRQLWKTSGQGFTERVTNFAANAAPSGLVARGNELFFSATTATGRELWRGRSNRPVLTVPPSTFTYTEDGPAQRLASTAQVTDADTPILFGGRLTIGIPNPSTGDRLELLADAFISTVGQLVLHNKIVIGKLVSGIGKVPLLVELNRNATTEAVEALVRSVAYRSDSQNPATTRREIRFYLTDGDGAQALTQVVQVDVVRSNDAPLLRLGGTIGYVRGQAAVVLASGASVADVDNANFGGGRLRVRISQGATTFDRLAIGVGFSVDSLGNVLQGTTIIGKRTSNGAGTRELVVSLNSAATKLVVQQLIRSITFKTVGGAAGQRKVVFTVSDGAGGVSADAVKTVNVT